MPQPSSKKKIIIIAICIILLLLIEIAVLLILFVPRNLTTIIPDLSDIDTEQVTDIEIIVRDPLNPDYTAYYHISKDSRIAEYVDIINRIKVKRVSSIISTSEQNEQREIKLNIADGSQKTILLDGEIISGTRYKVTDMGLIYLFYDSDTDIDFDGKGPYSHIDESFFSYAEGVTLLTDKDSFGQYMDTLINKDEDSLRTRELYKEIYTDEYFELKSIIMLNYKIPQGKTSVGIDSLIIDGETLDIVIDLETSTENSHSAKIYKLFMIEVNASDITAFSDYRLIVRDFSQS